MPKKRAQSGIIANSLTGTKKEYFAASMNIYRALVHMESPVQIDFERHPE